MNSFSFFLSGQLFICPLILRDSFAGQSNLNFRPLLFVTQNIGYNPILLLFILLLKLFLFWPLKSLSIGSSTLLIYTYLVSFQSLPYSLAPQNTEVSSCVFPNSALELTISPKSVNLFYWIMVCENESPGQWICLLHPSMYLSTYMNVNMYPSMHHCISIYLHLCIIYISIYLPIYLCICIYCIYLCICICIVSILK